MPSAHHVLIHEFDNATPPSFDDEGDIRVGSYFQFIDGEDRPISELIGPYRTSRLAERAAHRAFVNRDF